MKSMPLWQVELSSPVAFFDQSVIKIVTDPELITVPYCHSLLQEMLISENQWIPVLRFHETFECIIVLKLTDHKECNQIALTAQRYPSKLIVTDKDFLSDVQEIPTAMQLIACSAVGLNDQVIPIIDPNRLLNDNWLQIATATFASTSAIFAH